MIYVLDFGSQYSHLITRRIRELGVYAELVTPNISIKKLKAASGIVLSGGPQNLSEKNALRVDKQIFKLGLPILGICYGMQLMAFELGGRVKAGRKREYGPTLISIAKKSPLLSGLKKQQMTWMSHGDQVSRLPKGFAKIATSQNCPVAAMADEKHGFYGLQFHPEVVHTPNGKRILANFIKLTESKKTWSMRGFVTQEIKKIRDEVGSAKAICALSGGVDSAVAAAIVRKAIGKNLVPVYVDTGLMREGETVEIKKAFPAVKVINAKTEFLQALKNVTDPERKRKIIGEKFIRIFEREAKKIKNAKYLVQGTLYTDTVTSGVSLGGKHTAVIKSHHNVGGLPKNLGFRLVEPLRELYKDEVRKVGALLGLPKAITQRVPFPGPGLAVRIIGAVSEEKLKILRQADLIVREEIKKHRHPGRQELFYFAALPDIRSVGVQGDARTYGHPIILRAITTTDFMTAHFARLPYTLLEKISSRITNEVPGINRVVYDITSKPPGTIEWE